MSDSFFNHGDHWDRCIDLTVDDPREYVDLTADDDDPREYVDLTADDDDVAEVEAAIALVEASEAAAAVEMVKRYERPPPVKEDQLYDCNICLSPMLGPDGRPTNKKRIAYNDCGCKFHKSCIERWYRVSTPRNARRRQYFRPKCPRCRAAAGQRLHIAQYR